MPGRRGVQRRAAQQRQQRALVARRAGAQRAARGRGEQRPPGDLEGEQPLPRAVHAQPAADLGLDAACPISTG